MAALVVLLYGTLGFMGAVVYASFFEWLLHKRIMHTRVWNYPFHAHALVHHRLFRADHTYHLRCDTDKAKVTFAWWNGPGLLMLHLPLIVGSGYFLGWAVGIGGGLALVGYYVAYESLHWCMHVPGDRWLERTRVFQWLNRHHYLHHRYPFSNLNVVFPCADWLLGSLRRATTPADMLVPSASTG